LGSLINPFGNKKYLIIISSKSTALREPTLLKNLNFNAQIGALGHELAHTAYFHQHKKRTILRDGVKYGISIRYKEKFEKMTEWLFSMD